MRALDWREVVRLWHGRVECAGLYILGLSGVNLDSLLWRGVGSDTSELGGVGSDMIGLSSSG